MRSSRSKMETIGFIISIPATVLGVLCLLDKINPAFLGVVVVMSAVSYFLCGGISYAFKAMMKIAKFGWLVIPVFPFDIITGVIGFAFGFYILLLAPAFFTGKKYFENDQVQLNY
ncbi:MAG: hypothetical protein J5929_01340 [Eubacterium sp.]|nr:hypothetical protein [Eubacterium sp.]